MQQYPLSDLLTPEGPKFYFPGRAVVKNPPVNAGDTIDTSWIPGSGRSSGRGNDNSLQYSSQENSMDRGAWRAPVHGVAKSWTQLSDQEQHAHKFLSMHPLKKPTV